MITNFEDYTQDLNTEELKLVSIIKGGMAGHLGKEKAITNGEIRANIQQYYQIKVADARIRKIINYIRVRSLIPNLCATSKGYFIAQNKEEHYEYLLSLKERADAINTVLDCGKIEFQQQWREPFIS